MQAVPLFLSDIRQNTYKPAVKECFPAGKTVLSERHTSLLASRRFARHLLELNTWERGCLTRPPLFRLREEVEEDERRGGEVQDEKERKEPGDSFPNLYVLTKTTYSLKLAKAFTNS